MESKFKVGDYVEIVRSIYGSVLVGSVKRIEHISTSGKLFKLRCDYFDLYFKEDEVRCAKYRDTDLWRAINNEE